MYWWSVPSRIGFFFLLPLFLACSFLSRDSFLLFGHPDNYITGIEFWAGLAGLLAFSCAAFLGEMMYGRVAARQWEVPAVPLNHVITIVFVITAAAYALFLYPIVIQPSLLSGLIQGTLSAYEFRDILNRISGITTLMVLQSLFVVCVASYTDMTGQRLPLRLRYMTAIIVILCLLRAWLWSERLALLEIIVPFMIVKFALIKGRPKRWLIFAPLVGVIGIFFIFCAGEYFRSWQFVKDITPYGFFDYMLIRFSAYYATAINNGAVLMRYTDPYYFPVMTAQWFHHLPLWAFIDNPYNVGDTGESYEAFLDMYGTSEFNNPSGLYMPFLDYGTVLGIVCWAVLGFFSGRLAGSYKIRNLAGRIFYPLWFTGLFEILRIFYWGDQRFFPVIVVSVVVIFYLQSFIRVQSQPANHQ